MESIRSVWIILNLSLLLCTVAKCPPTNSSLQLPATLPSPSHLGGLSKPQFWSYLTSALAFLEVTQMKTKLLSSVYGALHCGANYVSPREAALSSWPLPVPTNRGSFLSGWSLVGLPCHSSCCHCCTFCTFPALSTWKILASLQETAQLLSALVLVIQA